MATPTGPTTSSTTTGTAAWAGTSGCWPGLAPPGPPRSSQTCVCASWSATPSPPCGLHYCRRSPALRERRPVEQALRENWIYLNLSRYRTRLERWLDHFPRRQSRVAPEVRIPPGVAAELRAASPMSCDARCHHRRADGSLTGLCLTAPPHRSTSQVASTWTGASRTIPRGATSRLGPATSKWVAGCQGSGSRLPPWNTPTHR